MTPDLGAGAMVRPMDVWAGSPVDANELFIQMCDELHRMATHAMAGERKDHTLQPTALLNLVWIRLFRHGRFSPDTDRLSIIRLADQAMRQILIDHARRRKARRRYGRRQRLPIDVMLDDCVERGLNVFDIHEALDELAQMHERQSMVVSLRFLWGFTVREVAEKLDVSEGTVEGDYRLARAWLRRRLKGIT
jgi:RNA polymerase sigma-70 factor, ECF subfamily